MENSLKRIAGIGWLHFLFEYIIYETMKQFSHFNFQQKFEENSSQDKSENGKRRYTKKKFLIVEKTYLIQV